MKIAVSGKGGVGKTTISSNLIKVLNQKGYNVFAVDADPDSSLGLALGIDYDELNNIKPVVEMRDTIGDIVGNGALYTLNPVINDINNKFCIDINGIKFLRMGGVKKGNSECYCRENTFLKSLVNSLLLDTKDAVVLDMGAGIEHLTRGTSTGVDLMIIVTEPGRSSIQTARVVENLAKDLKIKKIGFIANKIRNSKEETFINENFSNDELFGMIHYDEGIIDRSMGITPVLPGSDNTEIENILEKIIETATNKESA